MFVLSVNIWVEQGREEEFVAATRLNHLGTRAEPGNLRFDVLRRLDDPTRFMLYEVYRTPDDFASHQRTPHYLAWKEKVAGWMARPREGVKHDSIFPEDGDWR